MNQLRIRCLLSFSMICDKLKFSILMLEKGETKEHLYSLWGKPNGYCGHFFAKLRKIWQESIPLYFWLSTNVERMTTFLQLDPCTFFIEIKKY